MFQYAMGRALAQRNGAGLLLDVSRFARRHGRRYGLDVFNVSGAVASNADLERYGVRRVRGVRVLTSLLRAPHAEKAPVFREPCFQFDPGAHALKAPVYLEGYWQSARYFDDCADVVRSEFTTDEPLDPDGARLLEAMASVPSVSLHVRRGDYVADASIRAVHGLCPLDYYARAMEYVAERVEGAELFVFSDDMNWTRRNIRSALPTTFVDPNPACSEFRDMRLMSGCRNHILANSSYSWWGAWLDASPAKIVVAPRQWFQDATKDTRDLLPESWVTI
jgi:hypothetical protein